MTRANLNPLFFFSLFSPSRASLSFISPHFSQLPSILFLFVFGEALCWLSLSASPSHLCRHILKNIDVKQRLMSRPEKKIMLCAQILYSSLQHPQLLLPGFTNFVFYFVVVGFFFLCCESLCLGLRSLSLSISKKKKEGNRLAYLNCCASLLFRVPLFLRSFFFFFRSLSFSHPRTSTFWSLQRYTNTFSLCLSHVPGFNEKCCGRGFSLSLLLTEILMLGE